MSARLKDSVIAKIQNDADLFAIVTKVLQIKPISMTLTLIRNKPRLTEFPVLKAISDYTGTKIEDLIEENAEEITTR